MFWDNFVELCNSKGLSPNGVAKQIGLSSGAVTGWKNGKMPHYSTLKKLADYFNTSVSHLNGSFDSLPLILELLKKQGKKQVDLTNHLGLMKNAFTNWKSGHTESYKKYLPEIAEFLDVSVDYLANGEMPPQREWALTDKQKQALLFISSLSDEDAQKLIQYSEFITKTNSDNGNMFWDNFSELCKNRGVSPNKVAKDLSIASGTVSEWKNDNRQPQNSTLKKLANYFNVSVDYLLGNAKNNLNTGLSRFTYTMRAIESYLTNEQKQVIITIATIFSENNK